MFFTNVLIWSFCWFGFCLILLKKFVEVLQLRKVMFRVILQKNTKTAIKEHFKQNINDIKNGIRYHKKIFSLHKHDQTKKND